MVTVQELLKRSHKATCGIMERELTVPTRIKNIAIQKLQDKGYNVIGTSLNGSRKTTKIWFIIRGGM